MMDAQNLANTAWALTVTGELALTRLDPASVLCEIEAHGSKPSAIYYRMSLEALITTGKIKEGSVLLGSAEANGLLRSSNGIYYPMLRALREAFRAVGDSDAASRVQATSARLDSHAR